MSASGLAGPGFDPRRGGTRSGRDVHFLITRLYITGLDEIPNSSAVHMLRRYKFIVLLIAIRRSDGDAKPGGPFGAF